MDNEKIKELITRRRRQILVHSVIYYRLDENIISDFTWSAWASELARLQKEYPDIAAECPYAKAFEDFDGSSGCNLPLTDPWAVDKARYLLQMEKQKLY